MKKSMFHPTIKLIFLAVILFVFNIFLILQLVPVIESQTSGAKIVNLIIFPPNFIIEDLLGVSGAKITDYLTWALQFVYDYLIAGAILYFMKGGGK